MNWNLMINGVDLYHILNWLIIYSFLGWCWETAYVSLKQGQFVNRGFIMGPFCTIYGFGAVMVYLILKPVETNLLYLYLGGIIVPTLLEYLTAVLMETIFHTSWWDYSDKKFNFQGRICLGASLGWGIFTVILFRVFQPVVDDFVSLYTMVQGEIAVIVIGGIYCVDFCFSAATAFRLRDRIPEFETALERKQVELMLKMNEKINSLEFAKESLELARNSMELAKTPLGLAKDTVGFAKDSLDTVKDKIENLEDLNVLHSVNEKRKALAADLTREMESYRRILVSRLGGRTARIFKAYPHLNRGYRLLHEKKKNKH